MVRDRRSGWRAGRGELALKDRLIPALAEGGDWTGDVSAAIHVTDRADCPIWDIRIDYHPTPINERIRRADIMREYLHPHVLPIPTRADPAGEIGSEDGDDGAIA